MIEPGEHRGLAMELLSSLGDEVFWKVGILVNLLYGALATAQAVVLRQIDRAHATTADGLADNVAVPQNMSGLKRCWHRIPLLQGGMGAGGTPSAWAMPL